MDTDTIDDLCRELCCNLHLIHAVTHDSQPRVNPELLRDLLEHFSDAIMDDNVKAGVNLKRQIKKLVEEHQYLTAQGEKDEKTNA